MRITKAIAATVPVLLVVVMFSAGGCSTKPTAEEAITAITASGILKSDSFTVAGPITIVNIGDRDQEGYWVVNVKTTLVMRKPDGSTTEPRETSTPFRIRRVKNAAGKNVWKAIL